MKIYDIRAKVSEYKKGEEIKSVYATIGVVLETKNGGQMIKLETIPVGWDGVAYLNEPYQPKDTAPEDISGEPVDLSSVDLPF